MKKIIAIVSGLSCIPLVSFAAISAPITTVQALLNLMCSVFGWMFYGLIALAVIMVVVAGFNYVTAGDNAEKVGKANKMILYSAIGIAVALLAKGIPLIVSDFLGANSSSVTTCGSSGGTSVSSQIQYAPIQ